MALGELVGSLHLESEWEEGIIWYYAVEFRTRTEWVFVSEVSFHQWDVLPLGEPPESSIASIRKWQGLEKGFRLLLRGLSYPKLHKQREKQLHCELRASADSGLSVLWAFDFPHNYSPEKTAKRETDNTVKALGRAGFSVAPHTEALRAKAWIEKIPFG